MRGVTTTTQTTVDHDALGRGIAAELDSIEQAVLLVGMAQEFSVMPNHAGDAQLWYIGDQVRKDIRPEDRQRVVHMLVYIAKAIDPELEVTR